MAAGFFQRRRKLQRSAFHYQLPAQLIAREPLARRADSRLMVVKSDGEVLHSQFARLSDYLRAGDLLVVNDTRVIPARLFGRKQTGGAVEILIERLLSETRARAQIRASKSPKNGTRIVLDSGFDISVEKREQDMFVLVSDTPWTELLDKVGHMPLPPYMEREDDEGDRERYQTVYASQPGAVAAPTAGLHFDSEMFASLEQMGVEIGKVTLHVGAGTFQPVRTDSIEAHPMHSEWLSVPQNTVDQIHQTQARGGRIVAVGTTSVRCLETAFDEQTGQIQAFTGDTRIFLYPGKPFHLVDALITNFHLPESTLIMLVCAFAGYQRAMNAYQQAVSSEYRFFSYGDAMLLERNPHALADLPK